MPLNVLHCPVMQHLRQFGKVYSLATRVSQEDLTKPNLEENANHITKYIADPQRFFKHSRDFIQKKKRGGGDGYTHTNVQ